MRLGGGAVRRRRSITSRKSPIHFSRQKRIFLFEVIGQNGGNLVKSPASSYFLKMPSAKVVIDDIPFLSEDALQLRLRWAKALGGIREVSVQNAEWLELLGDDGRNTLAIEGEFFEKKELEETLLRQDSAQDRLLGAMNFFDAALSGYEFALRQAQENEPRVDKSLILQFHAMLFRRIPRSFSQEPGTWSLGERKVQRAGFSPLPPARIEPAIRRLLSFVNNSQLPAWRLAAVSHALFEFIHPFPDGNGRVGRLLVNFILLSRGLLPIIVKGIHEKDRERYYSALEATNAGAEAFFAKEWEEPSADFARSLEQLFRVALAESFDFIICRRMRERGELFPISEVARLTGRKPTSFRVACSQKRFISRRFGRQRWSHPKLLGEPPALL